MTKFILAYHGGKSDMTKEEGQEHMKKWKAWMDGMGDAVVNRGMSIKASKTVASDGVSNREGQTLAGITIIEANDMDAAVKLAKKSPHLGIGGTIEVAEDMGMDM